MRISTNQMSIKAINALLEQQVKLSKTQLQVATGKRVLKPSDDPVASATSLNVTQYKSITERYMLNANDAQTRLTTEEVALESVNNAIQRVRELGIQGLSSVYSDEQRSYLAKELRNMLDSMVQAGNTRDNNGQYLFAGNQGDTVPFARDAAGNYQYYGDDGQRLLQIGPTHRLADSDPGSSVFMNIRNGNGTFVVDQAAGNTGDAKVVANTVVDKSIYADHSYQIDFVDNAGTMEYTVTDTTSGAVVVAATPYVSGGNIAFDGISLTFEDQPADGDSYTVSPSGNQSLFTTAENMINALESDTSLPGGFARLFNDMNRAFADLDLAMDNILGFRALIGSRQNNIDGEVSAHENSVLQAEQTLSTLNDVDFAEAVARMNRQMTALEAAQQSYSRIQGLSLFDYL